MDFFRWKGEGKWYKTKQNDKYLNTAISVFKNRVVIIKRCILRIVRTYYTLIPIWNI